MLCQLTPTWRIECWWIADATKSCPQGKISRGKKDFFTSICCISSTVLIPHSIQAFKKQSLKDNIIYAAKEGPHSKVSKWQHISPDTIALNLNLNVIKIDGCIAAHLFSFQRSFLSSETACRAALSQSVGSLFLSNDVYLDWCIMVGRLWRTIFSWRHMFIKNLCFS